VQPPKGYARENLRHQDSFTPLNHLVDAVSPESDAGREFLQVAQRIAAGSATPQDWQTAHDWLVLWRDNDAKLQPLLANSDITQELTPLSRSLHDVAEIGLQTLDSLHKGDPVAADIQRRDLETLAAAEKPQAVLLLMVVPSVELLVKSARVAP